MEFQLGRAEEVLRRTPGALRALLEGVSGEWSHADEGEESWSPFDVMGHLIHAEETDWIPRAKIILEQGENGVFAPFDRFGMIEKSKGKSLADLLSEFEDVRQQSLSQLDQLALTPELLARKGLHPELGAVTLEQLLATWVVHDLGHVAQIARTMSKQYTRAVGPWQAYLSILNSRAKM